MSRKHYKAEQIIMMLREAEVQLGKGVKSYQICHDLGITENTFYRWRKEYGGMQPDQARKLKRLEQENARLKKLVADLSLDNAILIDHIRNHSYPLEIGIRWNIISHSKNKSFPSTCCIYRISYISHKIFSGPAFSTYENRR